MIISGCHDVISGSRDVISGPSLDPMLDRARSSPNPSVPDPENRPHGHMVTWAICGSLIGLEKTFCALIGQFPNRPPVLLTSGS